MGTNTLNQLCNMKCSWEVSMDTDQQGQLHQETDEQKQPVRHVLFQKISTLPPATEGFLGLKTPPP